MTLVECVPNFSEGRDPAVVDAIGSAIASVAGAVLLDRTMDADHNRSVITFAGPPESVGEAAVRAVAAAAERIDLTRQRGVHPRIGAADVIPFVPVEGVTLSECAEIAVRAGEEIWARCRVPVYLYEAAARRPQCVNLAEIRRGQFEGLREEVRTRPDRRPDIGGPELHPTAGASVVGARKFLIAYNINLATQDVAVAKAIALRIRFSSGGMPCVKALGLEVDGRAQVSMNLTDFETTPVQAVFDAVRGEAARFGVRIAASELIGLVPRRAIAPGDTWVQTVAGFTSSMILEERLQERRRTL